MSEITLLLEAVDRGEGRASDELLPLVYDELRRLAAARLAGQGGGQTLQPTALVHEAWLRLVSRQEDRSWKNRVHFFRAAAQAMRRILIDIVRHKSALKCGQSEQRVNIEDVDPVAPVPNDQFLAIDAALTRLEADDPECAELVTLKFFGGFTNAEIAKIQGVSKRTVDRQWVYAKTCLYQFIQENR